MKKKARTFPRTLQKYRMQAYRGQKRLAEFREAILQLKEKMADKEVVITGEAKEIFDHAVKIASQI